MRIYTFNEYVVGNTYSHHTIGNTCIAEGQEFVANGLDIGQSTLVIIDDMCCVLSFVLVACNKESATLHTWWRCIYNGMNPLNNR